jgi:hypothetical protein
VRSKDFIFLAVLAAFEGAAFYGSHIRLLLSKQFFYICLLIGGAASVLWVLLQIEPFFDPQESSCPSCGNWIRRGARFCGRCGGKIPANNILSMILDVIFLRQITGNRLSAPEIIAFNTDPQTERTHEEHVETGETGETVIPDYYIFKKCMVCNAENKMKFEFCAKCGGKLEECESREFTAVEEKTKYEELQLMNIKIFNYMYLKFWNRIARDRYDSTAKQLDEMAKAVQRCGQEKKADEMRLKAKQIRQWDLVWSIAYIIAGFTVVAIIEIMNRNK